MTDIQKYKGLHLGEQIARLKSEITCGQMMLAAAEAAYQQHAAEVVRECFPLAGEADKITINFQTGEVLESADSAGGE